MPTSLVTNFDINLNQPIDSRIIVTNSSSRDAINYKYDGLTVFQTDTRQSWTWNNSSATWSYNVAGNGIYGGSGSLIGNTYINIDTVGSSVGNTSKILGYYSAAGSNTVYLNNYLRRTAADSSFQSLAFRLQLLADSTPSSYIEFNPDYTNSGAFAIGSGASENFRINSNGKTGILMTAYGQSSFMVNGIASSEGIYISPDNSNTAAVGGGYAILVDNTGSLKIRDTSPNSPDFVNLTTPGYQVINIVGGRMLIGGTTSVSTYIPESRLEVYEPNALGTITGNSILLKTLTHNPQGAGIGNAVKVREWAVRNKTTYTTNGWESWRYHNGISVDSSFGTPNTDTRCFWEREPSTGQHWFGDSGNRTLTINGLNNNVRVGGTFSVGTPNTSGTFFSFYDKQIYYITPSSFIIQGGAMSTSSGTITSIPITVTNCSINVEAVFNSNRSTNVSRHSIIRASFTKIGSTITQIGTNTNTYDVDNSTGSIILPTVAISGSSLTFTQTSSGTFNLRVYYRIFISDITAAV
jgi:hypothetical protein